MAMNSSSLPKLVLADITGLNAIDVIAIHSHEAWVQFRYYCDTNYISFIETTVDDAAKILLTQDGVGMGCYTMHGYDADEAYERRSLALKRLAMLSTYMLFVSLDEPLLLVISDLIPNPVSQAA